MRYWDASAVVPLIIAETKSGWAHDRLAEDDRIITWAWTRTEIVSAIERRTREEALTRLQRRNLLRQFDAFASHWDEVTDILAVRVRANLLLARHSLRAADAGQLAAAMLVQEQLSSPLTFVCLDQRLSIAAELEGLDVMP
ncbi:MAG: type II toxin-antitoxin system VapC family toxin [Acidobacteriota bacterium]|nr:type II toxin-antitoxin system VapC family toxin [Acidobacteriota bacterium]